MSNSSKQMNLDEILQQLNEDISRLESFIATKERELERIKRLETRKPSQADLMFTHFEQYPQITQDDGLHAILFRQNQETSVLRNEILQNLEQQTRHPSQDDQFIKFPMKTCVDVTQKHKQELMKYRESVQTALRALDTQQPVSTRSSDLIVASQF
ncbi:hypothetical protein BLNAU_15779 [Blattamonas nauphoetae]|uniref:Uncharacterized protein n=1 Tax=Blattamonas nauphoetae TaxID=2049346 RepID=A0ABQ9X9T0_9EUKA|nr:hypothetical protein BLNAU_15779 [Blattamonas nauphoetae]